MNIETNKIIKLFVIYIAQVGSLWGVLEGYSYFKGDDLKDFLGPFWILIYILPLFTTTYIMWREGRDQDQQDSLEVQSMPEHTEDISTKGDYSPGKVGKNYTIKVLGSKQSPSSDESSDEIGEEQPTRKSQKNIRTKGNYSPGEVGGDYTVES